MREGVALWPTPLFWEARHGCSVEAHRPSGQDVVPGLQDTKRKESTETRQVHGLLLCCLVRTVRGFRAFKNPPPPLQIYTQWTLLLHPSASSTPMIAGQRQSIPPSHLPHLNCALRSAANSSSTSTQDGESHHCAGISNWPEGFLMVAPLVLIKI